MALGIFAANWNEIRTSDIESHLLSFPANHEPWRIDEARDPTGAQRGSTAPALASGTYRRGKLISILT
jgi:hypothetical protein